MGGPAISMTVNELYSEIGVRSPMKILDAYNGRVLCYNFRPDKEKHQALGERRILDIWAEIRISQNAGFGNFADVILCAYVEGDPEYEKSVKECQP